MLKKLPNGWKIFMLKNQNEVMLTIFTPTFNRAHTITRTYRSLLRQTCKNFIWLVIDDGSSDGTAELIGDFQRRDNGFEIQYIYKANGGMHSAHNTAYENIKTPLNVCIDSDDCMTDDAVEKILDFWQKNACRSAAGIIALDVDMSGKTIGSKLPERKSTTLMGYYEKGGSGDKKLIYRTDVIKSAPPYPQFQGEKYFGLAYKYHIIDKKYELLIMNEPVCIVEYQPDGSSMNMLKQYAENPRGFAFFRKSEMVLTESAKRRFIENIHYVSSSILSGNVKFISQSPKKAYTLSAIPFGILLALYIKAKAAHNFK